MVIFTKNELKEVLAAASKAAKRPNINGVRFEPGVMVATDGHRMNLCEGVGGGVEFEPFALARVDCESILRGMGKNDSCTLKRTEGGGIRAEYAASVSDFKEVDGVYPDWRQVLPQGAPERVVYVNAKYLKELAASCAAMDERRKDYPIAIEIRADRVPIAARHEASKFTSILMPQKGPKKGDA